MGRPAETSTSTGGSLVLRADADAALVASEREASLAALVERAASVEDPREARDLMLQAQAVSELLARAREPFSQARLVGKASVLAARKVGTFLRDAPHHPPGKPRAGETRPPSGRALLMAELGLSNQLLYRLITLSNVPDPDLQRYIQTSNIVPSISGAICAGTRRTHRRKRRRVATRTPRNPSVDEAYTLIVRALGHLQGAPSPTAKQRTAIRAAMESLYEAEDQLKPHRGGYTQ